METKVEKTIILHVIIAVFLTLDIIRGETTKYRALFQRMPLLRLTAIPVKTIPNILPEECARACVQETSFECKSFDIEFTTKTCRLQNHSHEEPFLTLQVSTSVDHYRPNYERLFQRVPNHILTLDHQRKIPGISVEQCARRCIVETAFKCMGFDFESKLQNCWLTNKTTQKEGIMKQSGSDLYERITDGPMENFINFGFGRLQQIEGEHVYNKIVIGVTLQACAQLCLAETAFRCYSFDFVFEDNSCHMSQYMAANVYGLDISFKDEKKIMHFEVQDEYLSKFYATPYTAVLGHNERTYHKVTPSSCARRCLLERTFVCRSFDYQTHEGTCLLSSKTGSDVGGLTKQGYGQIHHFEMKPFLDCGGVLDGQDGDFASPNWPRSYPHNMNCSWTIVVPKFKIIVLRFTHFDLGFGNSEQCKNHSDFIFVSEWITNNQSTKCLTKNDNEYVSSTNNVTLTFISNLKNDSQGFRVFYHADWPCGGTLTESEGQLSSPNWPGSYPASSSCIWYIVAPKGAKIQINFISIDLERHIGGNCNSAYDYIYVYENKNKSDSQRTFCGYSEGDEVTSSGNELYISFRSDERVQRNGFHAIYKFLLPDTTASQTTVDMQQTTSPLPVSLGLTRNQSNEIHMTLRAMFIENRRQIPKSKNLLRHDSKNENRTTTVMQHDDVPKYRTITRYDNGHFSLVTQENPEVVTVETSFRQALIIIVVVFVVIFFIIVLIMMLICRYYRKRLPKRRSVPNFPFNEENVSLYDKDNASNKEVQREHGDSESINLPQPSPSDPLPDVSFINPMYVRRNSSVQSSSMSSEQTSCKREIYT